MADWQGVVTFHGWNFAADDRVNSFVKDMAGAAFNAPEGPGKVDIDFDFASYGHPPRPVLSVYYDALGLTAEADLTEAVDSFVGRFLDEDATGEDVENGASWLDAMAAALREQADRIEAAAKAYRAERAEPAAEG